MSGISSGAILSVEDRALVRGHFRIVESQAAISSLVFYRNLFMLDPQLRPLFHSSIELQGRKLIEALKFAMETLENPAELIPVLESMGRRHLGYGTRDEHYTTMTTAMLTTLREILGSEFTPRAEAAWTSALGFISAAMIRGADGVRDFTGGALNSLPGESR
jgi:hemoglobin-like flavoprotein